MAKLTAKARNNLPDSAFALPKERKFPIQDASHARNALAREHFASPEGRAKIKSKVKKKFPNIRVEGEPAKQRNDRASRS